MSAKKRAYWISFRPFSGVFHHPVAIVAWLFIVIWAFNLFHAYAVLCSKSWRLGKTTLQELRRRIDLAMSSDQAVLLFSG